MPTRVRLIHWDRTEARRRAAALQRPGHIVEADPIDQPGLKRLRANPPDAFVIDLSRLPSQGRDVAMGLRQFKSTRHVPIVFVEGEPDKVARIKAQLPDATFTSWPRVGSAVKRALASPVLEPVVPASALAGYSGTPLPKKLGIKPGMTVALVDAPDGFEAALGELPEGATLRRGHRGARGLTLWFVRTRAALARRLPVMARTASDAGLWMIWPKQSSGVAGDLTQQVVREAGLGAGLVDFKICALDATWSGLRFTRRAGAGNRA